MKIKYLFGLVLATMLYSSCSEDMMDRINKDETSKTADRVGAQFQLTDAEVATAYSVVNGAYAWYVSSYTEQLFGTGNNQLLKIEQRQVSEVAGATTFNNEWNATYSNLMNLKQMIEKCSEGGQDEDKTDLLGMAQLLAAINWGVLTDLHGDIPFSESCTDGIKNPKIDSQETVYKAIFELIDNGIANLSKGGNNGSKQDIIYGGDTEKWVALGHALKARYLLHTLNVNNITLSQIEAEAQAAIDGGFEGFYLGNGAFQFNGVSADNAWSAYQWSRYYIGSSTTVDDLMLERNDPREFYYNFDALGGDVCGIPGSTELASLTQTVNEPLWLENGAANLAIMSQSEIYFILAEVQARQGKDAFEALESAVRVNMAEYSEFAGGPIGVYMEDTDVDEYIEGIMELYEADPLKEILIQKYLAGTRGEVLETYNDMRRIGLDEYPVKMTNPNNNNGGNRWPNMLPYGDSDVTSNPNVGAAFGSGNDAGMYIFTKKVWWAK